MTDQPPTNPGDIVVRGLRRPPNSGPNVPFNGRFESGSYETPVELEPQDGLDPQPERDRCADPVERLDIDADAAAAEGLRRMQTDANDPLLDGRERSIVIARDPVTGRVSTGNMLVGVLGAGTVGWDFTGIPMAHVIGLMHSHPGSGPYPSSPDQEEVFPTAFSNIQNARGESAATPAIHGRH